MNHLRRLTVFIDEPEHGHFYWVLIESTEDAAIWEDLASSEEPYTTWKAAWDAGGLALLTYVDDLEKGPLVAGEDEDASPVG